MNNQSILYGLIGLLVGGLLTGITAVTAVNANNISMMRMMGMSTDSIMEHHGTNFSSGMTMKDMVDDLEGKSGDDFDKAFLQGMIEHHQGAIDMAKEAQKKAKHEEVRNMAKDILSAQSKEIDQMQIWQGDWGYKTVPTMMMSH